MELPLIIGGEFMRKLFILGCLLFLSNGVFAAEKTIDKTAKPNNIIAIPSDTGVATFDIGSADFP